MEQLPPPPQEKELPAPNEKLLRTPTFWEKYAKTINWLLLIFILIISLLSASILLLKSQKLTNPSRLTITIPNNIKISSDQESILNAETGEIILTTKDVRAYLNIKQAGGCFPDAALSNNKRHIVFHISCLPGELPIPQIGVYNLPLQTFQFFIVGIGKNFTWSQDDSTITYEHTDLNYPHRTQTRTIDSNTGEILKLKK